MIPNRRQFLKSSSCGFGSLALSSLLNGQTNPLSPRPPVLPGKAKRVIFLFMAGGPSHVDSFDYKPELIKRDGQTFDFVGVRKNTFGKKSQRKLLKPLWDFKQHGQSGRWVSTLFPHIAKHVDDLCFIHSMHTEGVAHGPSTLFLHTGATNLVRPSMGSWVTYGLGTENENLPGFVTIMPSASKGGPRNYSNAFLPAIHQGTCVGRAGLPASKATIRNLKNPHLPLNSQSRQFNFLQQLNRQQAQTKDDQNLNAAIASFDLAFRMQMNAPNILDLSGESDTTKTMYGIGEKATDDYGRQCLMARRLAERGVRFIQVNYSDESVNPRWDQHSDMPKHAVHARATDQPVAALLQDLKQRGLLEDTLVVWGGEFGRQPTAEYAKGTGRDHNSAGFTMWMAGGGIKGGISVGQTDELGSAAVEKPLEVKHLHATILHQLGFDPNELFYNHAGLNEKLVGVEGAAPISEIIA
jgi:hypothetical protein